MGGLFVECMIKRARECVCGSTAFMIYRRFKILLRSLQSSIEEEGEKSPNRAHV